MDCSQRSYRAGNLASNVPTIPAFRFHFSQIVLIIFEPLFTSQHSVYRELCAEEKNLTGLSDKEIHCLPQKYVWLLTHLLRYQDARTIGSIAQGMLRTPDMDCLHLCISYGFALAVFLR